MALRIVLPLVVFCCVALSAQPKTTGGPAPSAGQPQDVPVFQGRVDMVLVPVIVRDAHGRPVGNLTRDDFQLLDKGKRQTIVSFSAVRRANPAPQESRVNPAPESRISSTPPAESAPAAIGAPNARPGRYLIYLFDDVNTDSANLAAVRTAAARHLEGLVPADRAAIDTVSGQPTVDFTSDRDKLTEAVRNLRIRLTVGHGGTECPDVGYFLANRILNQGDDRAHRAVVQRTIQCAAVSELTAEAIANGAERRALDIGERDNRALLQTLRSAIRQLSQMPGRRLIVLASPGFFMRTPEGIRAMAELLNQAAKAGVVISAIDLRGLYTLQPDAASLDPPGKLWQEYARIRADVNKDVMRELTEGTGGTFVRNSGDLKLGFDRGAAAPEFSYVLGFSPAALKEDGSFHPLKVRLPAGKGLTVQARRGYFALRPETAEEAARSAIHEQVVSREEVSGIPVGLQTIFSKSDKSHAKLTAIAIVDVRSLHLQKRDARNRESLIMVSALFDPHGRYVAGMTKTVNLGLRDETVAHAGSEITVPWAFDVRPGTYEVRLVVRELVGGAMSACNSTVTIP